MSNELASKIIAAVTWFESDGTGKIKEAPFTLLSDGSQYPKCLPVSAVIEWLKDKEAESGLSIVSNYTFKKLIPELRAIQGQEP